MNNHNRIFLCHASEDKEVVTNIYWRLKSEGLNPWLDKQDLSVGQNWDKEIRKALKSSRFIIIFFSNNSITKRGYVQREFKLALDTLEEIPEGHIFILPVKIDKCTIPESFQSIQFIELYSDIEDNFHLLIKSISRELGIDLNVFVDPRDGQVYKTIQLKDGKTWMASNLNFDVGKKCSYYENNKEYAKIYGRLYDWEVIEKASPPGWYIPSDIEWKTVLSFYGGYLYGFTLQPGENSKSPEKTYDSLIQGGVSGFSALLAGTRHPHGGYLSKDITGNYWTSDKKIFYKFHISGSVLRSNTDWGWEKSVRCIKY